MKRQRIVIERDVSDNVDDDETAYVYRAANHYHVDVTVTSEPIPEPEVYEVRIYAQNRKADVSQLIKGILERAARDTYHLEGGQAWTAPIDVERKS